MAHTYVVDAEHCAGGPTGTVGVVVRIMRPAVVIRIKIRIIITLLDVGETKIKYSTSNRGNH